MSKWRMSSLLVIAALITPTIDAQDKPDGARLYLNHCAACHIDALIEHVRALQYP